MRRPMSLILCLFAVLMLFVGCTPSETATTPDTENADTQTPDEASDTEETGAETDAEAEPVETMTFKWSMATAEEHPGSVITQEICDSIYEKTNGAIKIELYVANTLGAESETQEMVKMGAILGVTCGFGAVEAQCPAVNGWLLPYAFDSADAFMRFNNEYAIDAIWNGEILEATGLRTLGVVTWGARHLTVSGIDVNSPEDLAGTKIRSMDLPVYQAYVKALGGTPIPIAWNELYMALQTGTAQGEENPLSNIISAKFYEVQDTIILTGHAQCCSCAFVSEQVWQTIPEQYQTIIAEEFLNGMNRITETCLSSEEETITQLEEYGMTIKRTDEFDYQAFKDNAAVVIETEFSGEEYAEWMEYLTIAQDWIEQNVD